MTPHSERKGCILIRVRLPFATEPAPLHTSLNCVARKFFASRARINQRVPLTKNTLLDLLKKVCLLKTKFPQVSLSKSSYFYYRSLHKANYGINKEENGGCCNAVAQCQRLVSAELDLSHHSKHCEYKKNSSFDVIKHCNVGVFQQ